MPLPLREQALKWSPPPNPRRRVGKGIDQAGAAYGQAAPTTEGHPHRLVAVPGDMGCPHRCPAGAGHGTHFRWLPNPGTSGVLPSDPIRRVPGCLVPIQRVPPVPYQGANEQQQEQRPDEDPEPRGLTSG